MLLIFCGYLLQNIIITLGNEYSALFHSGLSASEFPSTLHTHTLSYISHCFHLCSVMSAVGIGFSRGVHDGSVSIESACSAGDTGDGYRLLGLKDPLEEEMATHFSILTWRTPWTEGYSP